MNEIPERPRPNYDAYICGPMKGHNNLNIEKFRAAQKFLDIYKGLSAVIPHDIPPHVHNGSCPPNFSKAAGSEHAECCYLRNDIQFFLNNCWCMYVLPGWNASNGGRLELQVAAQTGFPIVFIEHYEMVDIMYKPRKMLVKYPSPMIFAPRDVMVVDG